MVTSSLIRLVDSVNVAFVSYTTYELCVTNFGDYEPLLFLPWYATPKELSYVFDVHMAFLGVFLYVWVVTPSLSSLKNKLFCEGCSFICQCATLL